MNNETKLQTEVIRRVHIDLHYIEVGEWPEAPEFVELRTVGADNIGHFGQLNLVLTPLAALQLGEALCAAAREPGK